MPMSASGSMHWQSHFWAMEFCIWPAEAAACALLVTGGLFSAVLFSTAISDRIPSSIPFSNEESAQAAAALLQEHTTIAALLGLDVPDNGTVPVSTSPLPSENKKTFGIAGRFLIFLIRKFSGKGVPHEKTIPIDSGFKL